MSKVLTSVDQDISYNNEASNVVEQENKTLTQVADQTNNRASSLGSLPSIPQILGGFHGCTLGNIVLNINSQAFADKCKQE